MAALFSPHYFHPTNLQLARPRFLVIEHAVVLAIVMVAAVRVLVAAERYSSSHAYRQSTRRRLSRSWPSCPVPVRGSSVGPGAASSVHGADSSSR
jgi:hypothetical protein